MLHPNPESRRVASGQAYPSAYGSLPLDPPLPNRPKCAGRDWSSWSRTINLTNNLVYGVPCYM